VDGYKHLKFIVLIVSIVVTGVGCNDSVEHFDSTRTATAPTASPLPANGNSNSGTIPYLATSVNIEERRTWAEANKAFEAVPAEFRTVDFANFRFPFGRLTNGELVIERGSGGDTYRLDNPIYLDLLGDELKEAIVPISVVSCGVSCDGGSWTLFFFQSNGTRVKRFGEINLGSPAYGCNAKSIATRNKIIEIEQFGKCLQNSTNSTTTPTVPANSALRVSRHLLINSRRQGRSS
jgi:hypothetical protein